MIGKGGDQDTLSSTVVENLCEEGSNKGLSGSYGLESVDESKHGKGRI